MEDLFFIFIILGFCAASYETWNDEHVLRNVVETKLQRTKADSAAIDAIATLIDEAEAIQLTFITTDNAELIRDQYSDWFARTNKLLNDKLGASYGTTSRSAPGVMNIPMNHSVGGGGIWQAIKGKKIALNGIISDLRRSK
jgi:hypothetical protein